MIENSYISRGKRTILINAPLNVLHFSMLTCHGCQQLTGNSAALPHTGGDSTHYGPLTTMTNLGKRNELHSQCGHRAASMVSRPLQLQLRPRRRWSCRSSCRGSCSCTWAGRSELHWQYKARFDRLLPACLRCVGAVLCLRNS